MDLGTQLEHQLSFILLTESPTLLAKGFSGVRKAADFTDDSFSRVKAVILDGHLPLELRVQLENRCSERGLPFIHWSLPDNVDRDLALDWEQMVGDFLEEQNAWNLPAPSQETLDKMELKALVEIITTANSHLQPDEVMNTVMTRIHDFIPCDAWSVLIMNDNDNGILSFAAAYGPGKDQLAQHQIGIGEGIAGWVAQQRQPIIVNNVREDSRFLSEIDDNTHFVTNNILCAPLVSRGRTIGVIEMINREGQDGFTNSDLELLLTLVNPAAVAIENAYLFQKAQRLTIQDDLTKLFNFRHLNNCLEAEIIRSRRTQTPLSLIFLDLDGFKSINDNFGHLQGSQALIDISVIIKKCAREMDIVGRYGGDEFVLILPATDTEGAIAVAERIRDNISSYNMKGLRMTASIGLATYPEHGTTKDVLFRMADQAMYRVKEKGKNGILVAQDS